MIDKASGADPNIIKVGIALTIDEDTWLKFGALVKLNNAYKTNVVRDAIQAYVDQKKGQINDA
jgi:hypothetical protein